MNAGAVSRRVGALCVVALAAGLMLGVDSTLLDGLSNNLEQEHVLRVVLKCSV